MAWTWPFVAFFGVVGMIYLVGALLPRDHEATRSLVLRQSPDQVWAILRAVMASPTWRKSLTSIECVEGDSAEPTGWIEKSGRDSLALQVVEATPPTRLVTRIVNESLPFGGCWVYELTKENGGTRLRITERGFVKPPPLRFLARFIFGYTRAIVTYLRDLAAKTGNEPTIAP